jgi:1,4-dihydroxy-2-naphthoate octaprenyltransferase
MILNAIETPPSILQIIFGTLVAIKQHTKNWEWALLCLMVFFFF